MLEAEREAGERRQKQVARRVTAVKVQRLFAGIVQGAGHGRPRHKEALLPGDLDGVAAIVDHQDGTAATGQKVQTDQQRARQDGARPQHGSGAQKRQAQRAQQRDGQKVSSG